MTTRHPHISEPPARSATPPPIPASPLWTILWPLIAFAIVSGAVLAWWSPRGQAGASLSGVRFEDVTEESGISFQHRPTAEPGSLCPSTLSGAVVCFDYDGDGAVDVFLLNGAQWPWEPSRGAVGAGHATLYRNDGTGHFSDVSEKAGLDLVTNAVGAAAGDYDNDGDPDLVVTSVGGTLLYRNDGYGRFTPVGGSGVEGEPNTWNSGACWVDVDNDGWLDLVVCHYAYWPPDVSLAEALVIEDVGRSYGAPAGFVGRPPSVFHNDGKGGFARLDHSAGLYPVDPQTGLPARWALSAIPLDANGDGKIDLLLTFQSLRAQLFLNRGDGQFRLADPAWEGRHEGAGMASTSFLLGLAPGENSRSRALLQRVESATEIVPVEGRVPLAHTLPGGLADFDRDGTLEWFSGEAEAEVKAGAAPSRETLLAHPALYVRQAGAWSKTEDVTNLTTLPSLVARGIACADLDGDGDLDLVISQFGGSAIVLRNAQRNALPWLGVRLVTAPGQGSAYGARVEVQTPRHTRVSTFTPSLGLLSQSPDILWFGLGDDARVRRIVVLWPDGQRQEVNAPPINGILEVARAR